MDRDIDKTVALHFGTSRRGGSCPVKPDLASYELAFQDNLDPLSCSGFIALTQHISANVVKLQLNLYNPGCCGIMDSTAAASTTVG